MRTEVILIGGTFSAKREEDVYAAFGGKKLWQLACNCIDVEVALWPGRVDDTNRSIGAALLSEMSVNRVEQYDRIVIVGFSHGGNVAIEALASGLRKGLKLKPAQILLFTIATPAIQERLSDAQRINQDNNSIKWINIYDPKDPVQTQLSEAAGVVFGNDDPLYMPLKLGRSYLMSDDCEVNTVMFTLNPGKRHKLLPQHKKTLEIVRKVCEMYAKVTD
jgi:hypothetical protein